MPYHEPQDKLGVEVLVGITSDWFLYWHPLGVLSTHSSPSAPSFCLLEAEANPKRDELFSIATSYFFSQDAGFPNLFMSFAQIIQFPAKTSRKVGQMPHPCR